jgi:hypothetical protein
MLSSTHRRIGTLVILLIVVACGPALATRAIAHRTPPRPHASGRVVGAFAMTGQITTAVRVGGERPGQIVVRNWFFTGASCGPSACRRLLLRRQRSAGKYSSLALKQVATGIYAGRSRFYAGLSCRGQVYPRGLEVPYGITVTVTRASVIQGISFATALVATYTNLVRRDLTICPIGPSHDAARYRGSASPEPSPPTASFSDQLNPSTDTATFTDTSALGAGGGPIVSISWRFGDSASGALNTATTRDPSHHFTAPGVYQASLTVTDATGLKSTATNTVTVPPPPTSTTTTTTPSP